MAQKCVRRGAKERCLEIWSRTRESASPIVGGAPRSDHSKVHTNDSTLARN